MSEVRSVICEPGEDARIVFLDPGSETLNRKVGGYVCTISLGQPGIIAYGNDEALLNGLPWNRQLGPKVYIAGTIVVQGFDDAGDTRSLSADEAREVISFLNITARKLDHTRKSSIAELEQLIGERARRVYVGKDAFNLRKEICPECEAELDPTYKGFCPFCTTGENDARTDG